MSSRRVGLLISACLSTVVLIGLAVVAAFEPDIGNNTGFWLIALGTVAAVASFWVSYEMATVCDRMKSHADGRADELAGQIAAVGELVADHGDDREAQGFVNGARADNVRVLPR